MATIRQDKISRLLQKEMANFFLIDGKDLLNGKMVTVTKSKVTPDLSIARFYLSIFPSNDSEAFIKELRGKSYIIRQRLGGKIGKQIIKVTDFEFYIDDSLDYAERINELLKK